MKDRLLKLKASLAEIQAKQSLSAEEKKEQEELKVAIQQAEYKRLKIDSIALENMTITKKHVGSDELHTSKSEKDLVLEQFKSVKDQILEICKHQDVYHTDEKQFTEMTNAINLNTKLVTSSPLQFDSAEQKQSVLDFVNTPMPMMVGGGAGGAGSAHTESILDLTDTPSTMGTENQILAVNGSGVLAFTSNPTFASVNANAGQVAANNIAVNGSATLLKANGDVYISGNTYHTNSSTWGSNSASIDNNGNILSGSVYATGGITSGYA
jgi:hypothetical protein